MIKIYVFVTGLVLYQFTSTPGGTNYAILASGHFNYPGLSHIGEHKVTVQSGDKPVEIPLKLPLEAELSVNCPAGGCAQVQEPQGIPSLVDLFAVDRIMPRVQSGCTTFGGGANCRPRGMMVPGRNGLLAFTGNWSVEALTDCGGSTYPYRFGPYAKMNFVRAGKSWDLRFPAPNEPLEVVNSVLFTTVVETMDDLRISGNQLKAVLDPAKMSDCKGLRGFETSGATRCAVALIRNGSSDTYQGGGDLHFAALYALLDNDFDPLSLWLPIVSTENVCQGGGGTGGLSHCTGGLLPKR